jgi:DNA-directed RNA polymerase specialized sigma24 family protein
MGADEVDHERAGSLRAIALGFSYAEIEAATGKSFKGIDNAIQRGRRRLREAA